MDKGGAHNRVHFLVTKPKVTKKEPRQDESTRIVRGCRRFLQGFSTHLGTLSTRGRYSKKVAEESVKYCV
jgi:hypothetical protein